MQRPTPQISTCPKCGGVLEKASGGGLCCMFCRLEAGIGSEEEVAKHSIGNGFEDGVRFGVYEVDCHTDGSLCELGRGAMGVTYRATDTSLQRKVALKIIKMDVAQRSGDARERFVREARAAAALRHENIATIYQFGMRLATGQYFYAMELIEGETLDDRVHRKGPLDAPATIAIAQQVTAALAAAEKYGLVHRDLKPANLMLVNVDDRDVTGSDPSRSKRSRTRPSRKSGIPVVKIIDFGLAKAFQTATDPKSLTHDRFVGTPAFASPEQFEHSALDVRSDIYSLGETLWFALTGRTPFAGHTLSEIHRAQKLNVLPIEQLKAAHVPHRLKSLLESMLAFEPASRPGTRELAARLQRSSPEARSVRRTRVALAIATTVVFGLSTLFLAHRFRFENGAFNAAPDKRIAVLPFENLSPDPDNAYFADGVQDEILISLARIADLKVIGRTSVLQYKSGVNRDVRKIGHDLGVGHVLEGTVQRAGNRLRVNAQLVNARTGTVAWADQYDQDVNDVFVVQSTIAQKVASRLQVEISAPEKLAIERPPTTDVAAFDLYTRAKKFFSGPSFYVSSKPNLLQAVDLLNQSVARDPSFFRAYCQLAFVHDALYFFGHDHTSARLALAEAAVEAASRLRPDTAETHLARAWNLYWGHLDYDDALAELKMAGQTLPHDPQILLLTGLIQRRQGHWEQSTRTFERAADLDPHNFGVLQNTAGNYATLGRYSEQRVWLRRVLSFEPDDTETQVILATVDFESEGNTKPLRQILDSVRNTYPTGERKNIIQWWLVCALAERDAAAAKDALSAAGENPIDLGNDVFPTRLFLEGVIARMANDEEKAKSAFIAAHAEQEKLVQAHPDFAPAWCVLGLIDAALGRKEEALREGRHAAELIPVEKDAVTGPVFIKYLAMIAAWTGEKDLACEQLAIAARPPRTVTYGQLKLLPYWDPMRGDPRFEQILASLAPKN